MVVATISPTTFSVALIKAQIGSMPKTTVAASIGMPSATHVVAKTTNAAPDTPGAPIESATTVTKIVIRISKVISIPYILAIIIAAVVK